ncbi:hypothetical protein [Streptosporangium sp. NPDC000396]|uniref:hypothetical protein n=1 Tax=Streptosporangium sp. NPDC000396 TaxID=3366185 RepID=UPI0036795F8F
MVPLDVRPEGAGQRAGQLAERAEVHGGTALVQVADQEFANWSIAYLPLSDEFFGAGLAGAQGGAQALVGFQDTDVAQYIPCPVDAALVSGVSADVPRSEVEHVLGCDSGEFLTGVQYDLREHGQHLGNLASCHTPLAGRRLGRFEQLG